MGRIRRGGTAKEGSFLITAEYISIVRKSKYLWLTQAQMCELYQTSKSNVSEHIKHIFEEGELDRDSVVRNFRTTASDGKEYLVSHYNLDMIIALGIENPEAYDFNKILEW